MGLHGSMSDGGCTCPAVQSLKNSKILDVLMLSGTSGTAVEMQNIVADSRIMGTCFDCPTRFGRLLKKLQERRASIQAEMRRCRYVLSR